MNEDGLRKWVFAALGALFAVQLYFVRELLAALLLFGAIFLSIAIIAALIYVIREGGQRAATWAEAHLGPVFDGSRRALAYAGAFSKKPSPHPHSRPAR